MTIYVGSDNQQAAFLEHLTDFLTILVMSISVGLGVFTGFCLVYNFFEANLHVAILQAMWHQAYPP